MLDLDVVYDKLEQFETADQIAQFLQDQGVKAFPKLGDSCAIARWVKDVTETELFVNVGTTRTTVAKKGTQEVIWERKHTPAMNEFIQRFDMAAYPELICRDLPYRKRLMLLPDEPMLVACNGTPVGYTTFDTERLTWLYQSVKQPVEITQITNC